MSHSRPLVIETSNLTRHFGSVTAVDGLELEVREGEIFGLVGPDGAGKTTTLRMLCGLVDPSLGSARVANCDLPREAGLVKDRIGYMAQRFGLYPDLTVDENMAFYADLFGLASGRRTELAAELLAMTRMEPFRRRQAAKLSGGMKQKLGLMCALLHEPRVLLLDEPTNGVDPISRRDFWIILYRLVRSGITVLVTTAYLDEAERCNRVGLMHRGRLILCDSPERLSRGLEECCYELKCLNHRKAREWIIGQSGVLSAEPSGDALHIFLSPSKLAAERLVSLLEDRGLGPAEITPLAPSVEDVFIALVRKEELAAK